MRPNIVDGVIPRFRLDRRFWRLKINIMAEFCATLEVDICTDHLDVQEANVSVSQLCRIRDHIVGCWFAYGQLTCASHVWLGHWSAGNDQEYQNQPKHAHGKRELRPKSHPRSNTCWIRMWIYRTLIKFLRTHISLRKNHSCTFSKTTKLW